MKNIDIAYSLINLFEKNGKKLYLVGGSVRDFILFGDFEDFDFSTNALPEETIQILGCEIKDKFPLKFGTVKTTFMGKNIEITTMRKEGKYDDHRRPSSVEFIDDIYTDSLRRDLTINALYLDKNGIIDYHHGLDDLKTKTIRFIGDPKTRIDEDSIRLLRTIRFSIQLGFNIDLSTKNILINNISLLKQLSFDKFNSEIQKMKKYASIEHINSVLAEYKIDCIEVK